MKVLPALIAIGSLAAFVGMVLLGEPEPSPQPDAPEQAKSTVRPKQSLPDRLAPPAPSPFAHGGDAEAFLSYLAKRDARDFAHLFNIAVRMGAKGLGEVGSPLDAMRRLSEGVPGKGELEFRFRELTDEEVEAAISYLEYDGEKMICSTAAEYTEEELDVRKRVTSCKDGECRDCSDPRLKLQAREALAQHSENP